MRRRIRVLGISGAMAAAVVLCLVGSLWLTQPAAAEKAARSPGAGRRSRAESLHRPYRGQNADHRARQLLHDRRRL